MNNTLLVVSNVLLVLVTTAYVVLTRRLADAARESARHAAAAADSARRQADATDRAEAFAVLPILVCTKRTFDAGNRSKGAQLQTKVVNYGRGTAFNLRYRVGAIGYKTDWQRGEPAFRPNASTQRGVPWPDRNADQASGEHWMEVRYRDQTGRDYLAISDDKGISVSLVVIGEDGVEHVAEPLISYDEAFD